MIHFLFYYFPYTSSHREASFYARTVYTGHTSPCTTKSQCAFFRAAVHLVKGRPPITGAQQ